MPSSVLQVQELVDAMRRIGAGEYGVRLGATGSHAGECDVLSRAFDAMSDALDQRHGEAACLAADLRALTSRVESLQEEERSAIAIEIHDQIGQALTALKLDLAWVERKLAGGSASDIARARDRIASMMDLVDASADRVHNLAMELRPDVLDRLGLTAALEWQACQFQQRTSIATSFETNALEPIEPDPSTAMFRIAQEALTNVARHADAHRVRISLVMSRHDVSLEIADDGRGIQSSRPRLGLLGMRERALALGGDLTVVSAPGGGTRVKARLPLPRGAR